MRLHRVESEYAGQVEFVWKSFLLRPEPRPGRDLEKFRAYTRSWLRPNAEPESGRFQLWASDEGPPTHSLPPHQVAKAAARVGETAFRQMHLALMEAYFGDSRDIASWGTLEALWRETSLPEADFEVAHEPAIIQEILSEAREARELGVSGVPAMRLDGNDAVIVGAHPSDLIRRWIDRTLERSREEAEA